MAKLNKARTIAAALIGTLVLGASTASFAQSPKSSSYALNAAYVSTSVTNRGFNTRNTVAVRQSSFGVNNRNLATNLLVKKILIKKPIVKKQNLKKKIVRKQILNNQSRISNTRRNFR